MTTLTKLSLNPSRAKWRPAAVAVKKLDVPFIRANGEVIDCYIDLRPNERKLYRKAKLRRDAEREMKLFQKILTTEADLAQAREELKAATDGQQHKVMQYHIQQISALERKLAKLRGVKDPSRKRKTGRVFTKASGGLWVDMPHREDYPHRLRSWDHIAHDKLQSMEDEQSREKWETAEEIATLQGFKKGSVSHLQATSDALESMLMIERLQAFEATQSKYAHHADDQLRYEHFCDNR